MTIPPRSWADVDLPWSPREVDCRVCGATVGFDCLEIGTVSGRPRRYAEEFHGVRVQEWRRAREGQQDTIDQEGEEVSPQELDLWDEVSSNE